ncbi:hypothetical protein V6N12_014070 [Hibiscus sabdariffa]
MGAREFRCIQGSVDESKVAILQNCAVGLCALPLSIRELATKLRVPELEGFLIMRIVASHVSNIVALDASNQKVVQKAASVQDLGQCSGDARSTGPSIGWLNQIGKIYV